MEIDGNSTSLLELDLIKSSSVSNKDKTSEYNSNKTSSGSDVVNVDMSGVYKGLTIFADEVIKKLDEVMKNDLPDGIRSLNPEDHTSEKTADRIVSGVLNLYGAYQKQNPDKNGEELIKSFLETVRGGIDTGYKDAMGVLDNVGALGFEGVSDAIGKTMELVDSKLKDWEKDQMDKLKESEAKTDTSSETSSDS